MRRRVAVLGAGITGLSAANRLRELDPELDIRLFEAGERVGGVLETARQDGFLMEAAADGFFTTPAAAVKLCDRLGLGGELVGANDACRQALVLYRGHLLPVPADFQLMAPRRLRPLLTSPLLSFRGKLRAACELLIPARKAGGLRAAAGLRGRSVSKRPAATAAPRAGGVGGPRDCRCPGNSRRPLCAEGMETRRRNAPISRRPP